MAYLELKIRDSHEPQAKGADLIGASDGTLWVKLPRRPFAVGRSPHEPSKPHLKILEPTMSRGHFSIVPIDGGYAVRDDGSTAGTYINGDERLEKKVLRTLRDGDRIALGSPTSGAVAVFHTVMIG